MKKIVTEVSGEGLDKLLGEVITVTGTLVGVNSDCVLLENPSIVVYETGAFTVTRRGGTRSGSRTICNVMTAST